MPLKYTVIIREMLQWGRVIGQATREICKLALSDNFSAGWWGFRNGRLKCVIIDGDTYEIKSVIMLFSAKERSYFE